MVPPIDLEGAMALTLRLGAVSAAITSWLLLTLSRYRGAGGRTVAIDAAHTAWKGWAVTPAATKRIPAPTQPNWRRGPMSDTAHPPFGAGLVDVIATIG